MCAEPEISIFQPAQDPLAFSRAMEQARRTVCPTHLSGHQPTRDNVGLWTYAGIYTALKEIQGNHDETAIWSNFQVSSIDELLGTIPRDAISGWFFLRGWHGPWTTNRMWITLRACNLDADRLAAFLRLPGIQALRNGIPQEHWRGITEFFLAGGWKDPMQHLLNSE